jgi:hypothetical protein
MFIPSEVSVECYDWSHDMYGNPTCNYTLLWGNGKIGDDYEGGGFRTKRRRQAGYSDKASESALLELAQRFGGTWVISEEGLTGGRSEGRARFTAVPKV